MTNVSPDQIYALCKVLKAKGYKIFPFNIVGVRTSKDVTNRFDDRLIVWTVDDMDASAITPERSVPTPSAGYCFDVTTDPGSGTAVLAPGQYVDAYALGLHKGKYTALVQVRPVTVYRQASPIRTDSTPNGYKYAYSNPDTGLFGINIHRANAVIRSVLVSTWSAGCTVFADPHDFDEFIGMCRRHKAEYGNSFTYTLIEETDLDS